MLLALPRVEVKTWAVHWRSVGRLLRIIGAVLVASSGRCLVRNGSRGGPWRQALHGIRRTTYNRGTHLSVLFWAVMRRRSDDLDTPAPRTGNPQLRRCLPHRPRPTCSLELKAWHTEALDDCGAAIRLWPPRIAMGLLQPGAHRLPLGRHNEGRRPSTTQPSRIDPQLGPGPYYNRGVTYTNPGSAGGGGARRLRRGHVLRSQFRLTRLRPGLHLCEALGRHAEAIVGLRRGLATQPLTHAMAYFQPRPCLQHSMP